MLFIAGGALAAARTSGNRGELRLLPMGALRVERAEEKPGLEASDSSYFKSLRWTV